MISIELPNTSTKTYRFSIGYHTFVFSYTTVVAYFGPLGNCRRHNEWGPTTGKHLRNYKHFPEVDAAEMDSRIKNAIAETGSRIVVDRLQGTAV